MHRILWRLTRKSLEVIANREATKAAPLRDETSSRPKRDGRSPKNQ
jgi:hypothetical protein